MGNVEKYGIFMEPVVSIYESEQEVCEKEEGLITNIADEGIYGNVCRILEENGEWCKILTHYGYIGYVKKSSIQEQEEIDSYLSKNLWVVDGLTLDVVSVPKVQGARMISLPAGALLEVISEEDGWTRVKTCEGKIGYVTTRYLQKKLFHEDYLRMQPEKAIEIYEKRTKEDEGGREDFSLSRFLDEYYEGNIELFRKQLVKEAKKLSGVQYRWGGRTSWGIDCSGLVLYAYMKAGVLIYRDASIANGYAIRRLPINKADGKHFDYSIFMDGTIQVGDTLYFPGHIAMYIGEGKYIHSTGKAGDNGVVINSLDYEDELFRQDLWDGLYAIGRLK